VPCAGSSRVPATTAATTDAGHNVRAAHHAQRPVAPVSASSGRLAASVAYVPGPSSKAAAATSQIGGAGAQPVPQAAALITTTPSPPASNRIIATSLRMAIGRLLIAHLPAPSLGHAAAKPINMTDGRTFANEHVPCNQTIHRAVASPPTRGFIRSYVCYTVVNEYAEREDGAW
jgi:hypothetical protein